MTNPVILVIDDESAAAPPVLPDLQHRYSPDYRVESAGTSSGALSKLEQLASAGDDVALVLAGLSLTDLPGSQLLDRVRDLHPQAKRCLLISWGDWGDSVTGHAIFDSIARGRVDHYLVRPEASPDEMFHQGVSGLLLDWAEARRRYPFSIKVVGAEWSGRAHELREVLGRCAIPHTFLLADSQDGREVVAAAGGRDGLPFVVMPDGTVLPDPSNADLARAAGWSVEPEEMDFDLVIVGAGPAGLSAAVYGASEGFNTLVVDEGGVGGQSTSSALIRNYLGFPRGISGRRLAQQAYQQAWVFGANFAFMQKVNELRREPDGALALELSDFGRVRARAVILGCGASYNRLRVPQLEALVGAGVHYGGTVSEAPVVAGDDVYVLGAANSGGQAALHLARYARSVTLVERTDSLEAGMSHYLIRELESTPNVHVRMGTEVVDGGGDGWLNFLVLRDLATGREEKVEAAGLFVLIGASPRTDWLPDDVMRDAQGFVLTGNDVETADVEQVGHAPLLLETSLSGVFAAGDVRHGSSRRVAAAVGEGSVAVQLVHQLFAEHGWRARGRPYEQSEQESG